MIEVFHFSCQYTGNKGVSIMTEAASVRGDTIKDRTTTIPKKDTRSPWVHTIHNNG